MYPNRSLFPFNECIILASKFKDSALIMAKNRDRSYTSSIKIIHTVKNDIEMVYIYDTDAGYTEGDEYLSSKLRKTQAEKISNDLGIKGILAHLKKKNYKQDSNLNMNRDTDNMKTTGQIAYDLTNLIFYYDGMNGKS